MPAKTKLEIQLEAAKRKLDRQKLKAALKILKLKDQANKKVSALKEKSKVKSIKQLKLDLWKLVSTKVRLSSSVCYTCDKPLEYKDRSACHFWPKSSHNSVRFDEDNLRVGCNTCNLFKSGNLAEYSVRLLNEIGKERFDALAAKAHQNHKYQRDELENLIKLYESIK